MKLEFDSNLDSPHCCYQCPACHSRFVYSPEGAHHKPDCSESEFRNCIVMVGPKIIESIKAWSRKYGEESREFLTDVSLRELQEQIPEFL